jgi:hypothetical protein
MRLLPLCMLLLLLSYASSLAQEEPGYVPRPLSVWASGALGLSSFQFTQGSSWGISTSLGGVVRYHSVTLKYKWTQLNQSGVAPGGGFAESLSLQEVLLGYGFRLSPDIDSRTRLGVYCGLGQASHRHAGAMLRTMSHEVLITTATTVPLELELERHFSAHIGGAILAFVSFSSLPPVFGLSLSVRAGLL